MGLCRPIPSFLEEWSERSHLPLTAGAALTACGDDGVECFARAEYADVAERSELQQVVIAGDDERGVGGERTGEHVIIVGIAADGCW